MASKPPPHSANRRIDSWKEIAAFFGRDERTVKRWEKERALPVHRIPGGSRGSVYAIAEELTAWLEKSRSAVGAETPGPINAGGSFEKSSADSQSGKNTGIAGTQLKSPTKSPWSRTMMAIGATLVVIGLAIGARLLFGPRVHALTEKDTIVLTDFMNTTGDAVFDGTLRQGLAVQLEQSPFLNIISDQTVGQTLRQMGQPGDAKVTPEIAHEICQRTGSVVVLESAIANLGGQFVLGFKAVNCTTGEMLADVQERAVAKNQVLGALDEAASQIREKLGESMTTVQKHDTPLEQATTPSLEALQAYSLGRRTLVGKADSAAAVPFFQRAIQLDSNFSVAYAALGTTYNNLGQRSLATENARKAYDLHERVSGPEKFTIESFYFNFVTGDLQKALQANELWIQSYPRDWLPRNNTGIIYFRLGQFDKALVELQGAIRLEPDSGIAHANLATAYFYLDRLDEARATVDEAEAKHFDSPRLRQHLYSLAFFRNDAAGMAEQVKWSEGKPGWEDVWLALEADTSAYLGQLAKAREFTRRAVSAAERAEKKEPAASYEAEAALREALFGNVGEARGRAAAALGLSTGRDVQFEVALALAFVGEAVHAQGLADDLAKRFPEDTIVKFNYLPSIYAQLSTRRDKADKSIEILQDASPFEMGQVGGATLLSSLYPVYVRGEAYLAMHQGSEAAGEFQKILTHRGIVVNESIGALAHLGLARAYVMQHDSEKARAAYDDFFKLWKDSDRDIPILRQAKIDYAKLH